MDWQLWAKRRWLTWAGAAALLGAIIWYGTAARSLPALAFAWNEVQSLRVQRVNYWQEVPLRDRPLIAALAQTLADARAGAQPAPPEAEAYRVTAEAAARSLTFTFYPGADRIEHGGRWFATRGALTVTLELLVQRAEQHFGGELLPWSRVDRLFPRGSTAVVIDYDTGLRFLVVRRAGSAHADVQPLSAADTATMKHIYGGVWSWARRAVLVEVGGHRLAASMNGMPHGAGAIQGNNFPGHFCLHFLGSTTHRSGRLDPQHQLMVLKAAGWRLMPAVDGRARAPVSAGC